MDMSRRTFLKSIATGVAVAAVPNVLKAGLLQTEPKPLVYGDINNFSEEIIKPAVEALAKQIDKDILGKYVREIIEYNLDKNKFTARWDICDGNTNIYCEGEFVDDNELNLARNEAFTLLEAKMTHDGIDYKDLILLPMPIGYVEDTAFLG